MCLLFFSVLDDPRPDGYRLVLVNNRDEAWLRPTQPAEFWGPRQAFISGRDMEPGREGGTWLGMGQNGRLGCLLNIMGHFDPSKQGRGFLVTDFLCGSDSVKEYLQQLEPNISLYSGFHLVLLQLSKGASPNACISSGEGNGQGTVVDLPGNTVHGFGNGEEASTWQKVLAGKSRFADILAQHPSCCSQEELVSDLLDMMADRRPHLPDPVLESKGRELGLPEEIVRERSALCVWSPTQQYGTRTTTVILVTSEGVCHYFERDLQSPPADVTRPQYSLRSHVFRLEDWA